MAEYTRIASTRDDESVVHDPEGWDEYVIIETDKPLTQEELMELVASDFNSHLGCEGCPGRWFVKSYGYQARMLGGNRYLIVVGHMMDI